MCAELNSSDTDYIVRTISLDKNPKVSMGGFHVLPDYAVDDYPTKFSLLILAGGNAWAEQKNNDVFPLVEYAVKNHIPVGAICNAVNFMAENGFLNEIKHSGNTLEFMKSQAPHYKGDKNFLEEQAVCDANIITANGSGTLEFARKILTLLNAKSEQAIVINSLRIAEVPLLPYMERPADTREGCKHRCTDAAMEYFKAEVMEMCHRENLYQIDLLHGSKNRITEREYWAKRKGQAALDKENASLATAGEPPKLTKFETDKEKLRRTIRAALSSAVSFEDFSGKLLQQGVTVKESRGRLSYLTQVCRSATPLGGRASFRLARQIPQTLEKL